MLSSQWHLNIWHICENHIFFYIYKALSHLLFAFILTLTLWRGRHNYRWRKRGLEMSQDRYVHGDSLYMGDPGLKYMSYEFCPMFFFFFPNTLPNKKWSLGFDCKENGIRRFFPPCSYLISQAQVHTAWADGNTIKTDVMTVHSQTLML